MAQAPPGVAAVELNVFHHEHTKSAVVSDGVKSLNLYTAPIRHRAFIQMTIGIYGLLFWTLS